MFRQNIVTRLPGKAQIMRIERTLDGLCDFLQTADPMALPYKNIEDIALALNGSNRHPFVSFFYRCHPEANS